jgi:DNA-binding SARP family transcriptional activator
MLEFRTLGAIDLKRVDGQRTEPVSLSSKPLSLLAYLCASCPPRLHRRDTLIALLWPELDDAHARGALRQELYQLRRALGPGLIVGERDEAVGIDDEQLWCDASAFDAALNSGRAADALALWHGEFLPGLYVNGGEFERWVDERRDQLARRATAAARELSEQAEKAGKLSTAVASARRLTELAPYDETAWQRLISLLDRTGDRAGALTAYDSLKTRLLAELAVDPSPETSALAEQIRNREAAFALPPPLEFATARQTVARVVIASVDNLTGTPGHDALSQRLADRLIQGVAGLAFVEVVVGGDAGGANATVSAALYPHSGRVEARTRIAAADGRILAMPEPVSLDPDAGDEDLDGVVARVLASIAAQFHPSLPIALASGRPFVTPSWQAFHEFFQGSEAFGAFRFKEAASRLRRSYEIDPRFLIAAIFAGIALAYADDPAGADSLVTAAMADAGAASEYERHFGEWFLADLHGHRPEAYRAAMEVIRLTSYVGMQGVAAREALRMNRPGEAVRLFAGIELVQRLGWWRNWVEAYEWRGAAFHLRGDHNGELANIIPGRESFPEALEVIRAETRARAALNEPAVVLELVEEALTMAAVRVSPADVAWTAAQELEAHGHAEAGHAARKAGLGWLARCERPARVDRLLEVRLLLEIGEIDQAAQRLQALAPLQDLDSLGLAGLVAAAVGDTSAACRAIAQLQGLENPYLSGRHLLLAAGIRAALGQPEAALDTLRRALAAGLPFGVELHALPILQPLAHAAEFQRLLRPRD